MSVEDKKLEKFCEVISDEVVSSTVFHVDNNGNLVFTAPFFESGGAAPWYIWDEFFSKDYERHLLNKSVGLNLIKDCIKFKHDYLSFDQIQKMMPYIYRMVSEKTIKKSKKYSEK